MIENVDALLEASVRTATPLALAALGETVAERAGVINIGLEGIILAGAFGALVGASAGALGGVAAALLAGLATAAVFAAFALGARTDQIIAGTAVTLLATGITGTAYRTLYGPGGRGVEHSDPGAAADPAPVRSAVSWPGVVCAARVYVRGVLARSGPLVVRCIERMQAWPFAQSAKPRRLRARPAFESDDCALALSCSEERWVERVVLRWCWRSREHLLKECRRDVDSSPSLLSFSAAGTLWAWGLRRSSSGRRARSSFSSRPQDGGCPIKSSCYFPMHSLSPCWRRAVGVRWRQRRWDNPEVR